MNRRLTLSAVALATALVFAGSATAGGGLRAGAAAPFGWSSAPYFSGFYQPYGIRYSTSVRTPPYFAVNPPVYYGARHTRPYGISPFASLPQVTAGEGYHSRPYPGQAKLPAGPVLCNPFCDSVEVEPIESAVEEQPMAAGPQRRNPFAVERVAARQ